MTTYADGPVLHFRDEYDAVDFYPAAYLDDALPLLRQLGWLSRSLTEAETERVHTVLDEGYATDLDESDTFPFFLLWALRAVGVLEPVEGLDEQLREWRDWEETDHCRVSLGFLPPLPAGEGSAP